MDIRKLRVWRSGLFRGAKFWLSAPSHTQKNLLLYETGNIEMEHIPLYTGFVDASKLNPDTKKSWEVEHGKKFHVYKNGVPVDDETVLVLSERTYRPLQPQVKQIESEIAGNKSSLEDIGVIKHNEALHDVAKGGQQTRIQEHIINACIVLCCLFAIAGFLLRVFEK